jgi:uncharacterized membrane protein
MLGLTYIGAIHTAISLIAVGTGLLSFIRIGRIEPHDSLGKTYIVTTVLTCVTGFGIFAHGGFGKPHALGIITLLVLALAWIAHSSRVFGRRSEAVEVVSMSLTFFFHMIPAVTETSTRLPQGRPLLPSAEAPELQAITGVMFLLFLLGVTLQLRRLNASDRSRRGAIPT